MTITENNTNTAASIIATVKQAVQNYNNGGDKSEFYSTVLNAINAVGIENVAKATGLKRVEIYDALDGVNPSFDHLSAILAFFGVKINLTFIESACQVKTYLN